MNFSWLIILSMLFITIIILLIFILLRTKQSSSNLELNEIKAQLDIIASTGTQSQEAVTNAISNQQARLNDSMTNLSDRLNLRLNEQTTKTSKELSSMHERLAVIDAAQENILELSQQVSGLQNILSNNQARGSFGEVQLENIIKDILSQTSYSFQHTLSNNKRVDCLVKLPGPPGNICIDSKFPLEAWRSFIQAKDESDRSLSLKRLKIDIEKHIKDIAEKYIIPGETADTAVMFLPSESVYAGINLHLPDSINFGRSKKVFMAGPDNLMLLLNTVRAVLRDAKMSESAVEIKLEVGKMMDNVSRLDERVNKLNTHFAAAQSDINAIQTSTGKITRSGQKIEEIEVNPINNIENQES